MMPLDILAGLVYEHALPLPPAVYLPPYQLGSGQKLDP